MADRRATEPKDLLLIGGVLLALAAALGAWSDEMTDELRVIVGVLVLAGGTMWQIGVIGVAIRLAQRQD